MTRRGLQAKVPVLCRWGLSPSLGGR